MTATPFLEAWFEIMDSDTPERVLDLITDDFVMSFQFSQGEGLSAEFVGDHAGLEAYLEQREKSRDYTARRLRTARLHVIDMKDHLRRLQGLGRISCAGRQRDSNSLSRSWHDQHWDLDPLRSDR